MTAKHWIRQGVVPILEALESSVSVALRTFSFLCEPFLSGRADKGTDGVGDGGNTTRPLSVWKIGGGRFCPEVGADVPLAPTGFVVMTRTAPTTNKTGLNATGQGLGPRLDRRE